MCGADDLLSSIGGGPLFVNCQNPEDPSEAPLMNVQQNLRNVLNIRNQLSVIGAMSSINIVATFEGSEKTVVNQ